MEGCRPPVNLMNAHFVANPPYIGINYVPLDCHHSHFLSDLPLAGRITKSRNKRISATDTEECDGDNGKYEAGLPGHDREPDECLWLVSQEPESFIVVPWTVLLLIRASRHMNSNESTVPRGRAQFEGILGPQPSPSPLRYPLVQCSK